MVASARAATVNTKGQLENYLLDKLKMQFQPVLGTAGAPVAIVVFSDLQCPHCKGEAEMIRKKLLGVSPQNVRLYFKDPPLQGSNEANAGSAYVKVLNDGGVDLRVRSTVNGSDTDGDGFPVGIEIDLSGRKKQLEKRSLKVTVLESGGASLSVRTRTALSGRTQYELLSAPGFVPLVLRR